MRTNERDYLSFRIGSDILLGIWYTLKFNAFDLKTIDFFGGGGFSVGIPKPLSAARVALRMMYLPEALNNSDWHMNPKNCTSRPRFKQLGGTLYLEIFPLPPPAEIVGKWTFRPHTNTDQAISR